MSIISDSRWIRVKVLVTGGLGFIGQALTTRLLVENHSVRILDNLTNPSIEKAGLPSCVEVVEGDIRDRSACNKAAKGVETVIHLAAQTNVLNSIKSPFADMEINCQGFLNVLDAMKEAGGKRFVFSSSNAMVGVKPPPMNETLLPAPLSPYGCTKLLGESYAHAYHALYGIHTVCLRFANVYGPGAMKKGSVVAKMIKTALRGQPLVVYGDGNQTRDFIYIDDIVSALLAGVESKKGGEVYCVGTGVETTVNSLVEELKAVLEPDLGKKVEVQYEPARNGEVARNFSDISKARKELNFAPKTNLREGLALTWEWFKGRDVS